MTVKADAFLRAIFGTSRSRKNVIYSLAFGDQTALICDLVDWARTCGFPVVAAGRGHKWLPHFSQSTPDTVWGYYGLTEERASRVGLSPKMFNSFFNGSKPSNYSTAVSNATGLSVPSNGSLYLPASIEDTPSDRYFTLYKRWHLIGLEVGVSVASVAISGQPTGVATAWSADVVATAKRDLKPGEVLDGAVGYAVWGKLLPATKAAAMGGVPLWLMQKLTRTKSGARWRICSRHRRCKCKPMRGSPTSRGERAPPIQHLSVSVFQ